MSRLRFATARALYEAFPPAVTRLKAAATDDAPLVFLKDLSEREKVDDAVTFCAYLLPRREAVGGACGGGRRLSMLGASEPRRPAGLGAAEAWVREPDEAHRSAALDVGLRGDHNDA